MALATLRRLTYRYPEQGVPALDAVTLDLDAGLTLVAGPSGGGKSTLLRVLNGLVPHFHGGRISGRATVAGLDVIATPTRRLAAHVGFVFQDPEAQAVYQVVEREVAFGLENLGVPRAEMHRRVDAALARLGLEALRGRLVAGLSGGERQRVALAGALALGPEILVLDEPTSQLDPEGAAAVANACRDLASEGRAVVVGEHRLDGLLPLATRVVGVVGGQALEGPPGAALAAEQAAGVLVARQAAGVRRPPQRDGPARGEVAWSLRGLTAGNRGRPAVFARDVFGARGEVVALTGPNGGGKTTLLRTLAGLIPPLDGSVERPPGRAAYLPQNPSALLHRPSVAAEVELTLRRSRATEPVSRTLDEMGLMGLASRYPRDLSCGERQRAAIAAAIAGAPSVALLDEPTRGMDAAARRRLCAAVRRLAAEGCAVVLATHDRALAAAAADRVLRVAEGAVTEVRGAEAVLP